MTEQEACCMVAVPMLVTLWHIHQRDIVHADIKIDNIFITQNRAMLGDFGMTQTVRVRRPRGLFTFPFSFYRF